jgi:ribonucleoside-diphosphate reductase alpha chain
VVNPHLMKDLIERKLWNDQMKNRLVSAGGSVQNIAELPDDVKELYKTVWEIPQKEILHMAVDRAAFIDQSQSLNLFIESPNIGQLSSMYFHAWKQGLKTTYYLRSRPATKIAKATVDTPQAQSADATAVACSLENPGSCEACQ